MIGSLIVKSHKAILESNVDDSYDVGSDNLIYEIHVPEPTYSLTDFIEGFVMSVKDDEYPTKFLSGKGEAVLRYVYSVDGRGNIIAWSKDPELSMHQLAYLTVNRLAEIEYLTMIMPSGSKLRWFTLLTKVNTPMYSLLLNESNNYVVSNVSNGIDVSTVTSLASLGVTVLNKYPESGWYDDDEG